MSSSGLFVDLAGAYGLPAVASVIRGPAELIASMPFRIYRRGDQNTLAMDVWQWPLLHDSPMEGTDTFEFFYDVALSLEATENAFIQKIKTATKVIGLEVLDPQRIRVRRDPNNGQKVFDWRVSQNETRKGLTTADILHVRGFVTTPGALAGVSRIAVHQDAIGAALAQQQFEGDYFRNDAQSPVYFTGATNRQQAEDLIDLHNQKHQGVGKRWQVGALWGAADVKVVPLSMADAAFVEAKKLSIEDACRIWGWPKELVAAEVRPVRDADSVTAMFLKFNFLHRLRRIEKAFSADLDLFPRPMGGSAPLFGEFLTVALERADITKRYAAYLQARQAGWRTANEIRADENYPPDPRGDELQMTPVGGAPNPKTGDSAPQTPPPEAKTALVNGHHVEQRDLLATLLEE